MKQGVREREERLDLKWEDLGSTQPFNGQKSGTKTNIGASVSSSVKWEINHEMLISECEGMHFPFERQCNYKTKQGSHDV